MAWTGSDQVNTLLQRAALRYRWSDSGTATDGTGRRLLAIDEGDDQDGGGQSNVDNDVPETVNFADRDLDAYYDEVRMSARGRWWRHVIDDPPPPPAPSLPLSFPGMQLYTRRNEDFSDYELDDEEAEAGMVAAYLERHCGPPGDGSDGSQSVLCLRLREQQQGSSRGQGRSVRPRSQRTLMSKGAYWVGGCTELLRMQQQGGVGGGRHGYGRVVEEEEEVGSASSQPGGAAADASTPQWQRRARTHVASVWEDVGARLAALISGALGGPQCVLFFRHAVDGSMAGPSCVRQCRDGGAAGDAPHGGADGGVDAVPDGALPGVPRRRKPRGLCHAGRRARRL